MKTIDKIITKVNSKYGAPIGRLNRYPEYDYCLLTIDNKKHVFKMGSKDMIKIFDCAVPMNGAYDRGGAYWGYGSQLRVSYTKDLEYINFYRT